VTGIYGRNELRVRRYVGPNVDELELFDEYALAGPGAELDAALDGNWAYEQSHAGRVWRIVIDDPALDTPVRIVLTNDGAVEWQDDRDQQRDDDRNAFGWGNECHRGTAGDGPAR
jgi:hypothetical protein